MKRIPYGISNFEVLREKNYLTMYSEKENFKSLLFYLGMLTIKEAGPLGTVLRIPNYVIRTIYWEQQFQNIRGKKD